MSFTTRLKQLFKRKHKPYYASSLAHVDYAQYEAKLLELARTDDDPIVQAFFDELNRRRKETQ